jgi:uncharacterized repeat protein (TIGR01451 family)
MNARRILSVSVLALALVVPASADANTTVGSIARPSSSDLSDCTQAVAIIGQATPAYEAPASGGVVTSWSINATGDGSGTETLYVLAPSGSGYTVVGLDSEAIPATIPAGGTVTYNLKTPIATQPGDTFGVSATGTGPVFCAWTQGTTPVSDYVWAAEPGTFPTVGQPVTPIVISGQTSIDVPAALLDLEVTLAPGSEDVAVTTTAGPSNAIVGNEALLSSSVTNNGPFGGTTTTFTDTVPAGLTIDAVAAAGGTCTVGGQVVTCMISNLAAGASTPVEIVVTPGAAGSYENSVSVADPTGVTDPNMTNNASSATLTVGAGTIASELATRDCVTTSVKGLSEKVVKNLLPSMGCTLGKIKKASSKKIAKGYVIALTPGSGAHAPGTKVTITVSSGKSKSKKHKKH